MDDRGMTRHKAIIQVNAFGTQCFPSIAWLDQQPRATAGKSMILWPVSGRPPTCVRHGAMATTRPEAAPLNRADRPLAKENHAFDEVQKEP